MNILIIQRSPTDVLNSRIGLVVCIPLGRQGFLPPLVRPPHAEERGGATRPLCSFYLKAPVFLEADHLDREAGEVAQVLLDVCADPDEW